jgi:hypothetical protein
VRESVAVRLSAEAVERIAESAAEIVLARLRDEGLRERPTWLYGAEAAAAYLGWPRKRVYNRLSELPHHRDGSRLVFSTSELDAFLASTPPSGPSPKAPARPRARPNENAEGSDANRSPA